MATVASKQQTIVTSVGVGLKLLPFFIQSLEGLFGKKTGQTKKAAAQELFNAAALGTAAGFGIAGDQQTSDMIGLFRPVVSATIDEVAAQLFPPKPEPTPITSQSVTMTLTTTPTTTLNTDAAGPDPVLSNAG